MAKDIDAAIVHHVHSIEYTNSLHFRNKVVDFTWGSWPELTCGVYSYIYMGGDASELKRGACAGSPLVPRRGLFFSWTR